MSLDSGFLRITVIVTGHAGSGLAALHKIGTPSEKKKERTHSWDKVEYLLSLGIQDAYLNLPSSSGLSALCNGIQTIPICHTIIQPIICPQCIHKGACTSFCCPKNAWHFGYLDNLLLKDLFSSQLTAKVQRAIHILIIEAAKPLVFLPINTLSFQKHCALTLRSKSPPSVGFSMSSKPHVCLFWSFSLHSVTQKAFSTLNSISLEQTLSISRFLHASLQPSNGLPGLVDYRSSIGNFSQFREPSYLEK